MIEENKMLKNENQLLKNENQFLKKENQLLKNKLDDLNLTKDEEIKKLNEKYKILNEKNKELINNLKSKLYSNIAEHKNFNGLPDREKLIAINIISVDKQINHCIICKNNTKFFDVESDIYRKYPKYSKKENLFTFCDNKINRMKTLEENGIIGYTIILNQINNK